MYHMITGPGRRSRRQTSEIETDSEIEKLISIPASQRTQHQKEQVYSYVSLSAVNNLIRIYPLHEFIEDFLTDSPMAVMFINICCALILTMLMKIL